jgi:hypothetical protein
MPTAFASETPSRMRIGTYDSSMPCPFACEFVHE